MGTRNLTAVRIDGEYKVAQYGQWDGYPDGQGMTVLSFLRTADLDAFKSAVRKCSWIQPDKLKARWVECGADPNDEWVSMADSDRFKARHPHLYRDAAAKVLGMIAASPDGLELNDDLSFAADSLFCEWAYVIDFDKGTFEVYEGFNGSTLDPSERFAGMKPVRNNGYEPIRLSRSWPLDALPSFEEFMAAFE